jgi:hypothetical protein
MCFLALFPAWLRISMLAVLLSDYYNVFPCLFPRLDVYFHALGAFIRLIQCVFFRLGTLRSMCNLIAEYPPGSHRYKTGLLKPTQLHPSCLREMSPIPVLCLMEVAIVDHLAEYAMLTVRRTVIPLHRQ